MKHLLIYAAIVGLMASTNASADLNCYSDGVRVGVIQKFSKKGTFNKSWEGELVMDGLRPKNSGAITNVWKFSATDPAVAAQIDDAVMSGKEVAMKYCQVRFNVGVTDTDYVITKVVVH